MQSNMCFVGGIYRKGSSKDSEHVVEHFVREQDGVPKARLLHTHMQTYQQGAILTPLRDRCVAAAVENHRLSCVSIFPFVFGSSHKIAIARGCKYDLWQLLFGF
jgi:hypothetical protein